MINPKALRETPELIEKSLKNRGCKPELFKSLTDLDILWRKKQGELEVLQSERNKSVPKGKPTEEQREMLSQLSKDLKVLQVEVNEIKEQLTQLSYEVPNILQNNVPIGSDENDNQVIRIETQAV